MRDPYRVLGVPRSATQADIKKAFRDLARVHHPDSDPNNPWAEDDFKEIAAAYELLSDAERRRAFDAKQARGPGAGRTGAYDARGRGSQRAGSRPGAKARPDAEAESKAEPKGTEEAAKTRRREPTIDGIDITYDLTVPFLDAAKGCRRSLETTAGKTLNVSVPAGARDGTTLRLKGQGMRGFGGGKDGDALVTVHVDPHPAFRVENGAVVTDANVTLQEAVLGGKIDVATIDGTVQVSVPPGSNTGTRLRLRGKGLADPGKATRGDQLVALTVVLPKEPDPDLEKFVAKWGPKHPYTVR
jgi:DnaJ-class molecular chaperone